MIAGRARRSTPPSRTRLDEDRRATTAVEFGLVGLLFLALVLFTCEIGFYLYAQLSLDYATASAARQLLTGNSRPASAALFTSANGPLCQPLQAFLNCANVVVNLTPLTSQSYAQMPPPSSLLTNGKANTTATYNPGSSGSLMLLQVVYSAPNFLWPIVLSSGNSVPIYSTAAFVNEN